MNIVFELIDKEDEPLISLPGKEYIPPIGTMVFFFDELYDEEVKNMAWVEETGIAESYWYDIRKNTLHIYCKTDYDIDDIKNKQILRYNTLKYK